MNCFIFVLSIFAAYFLCPTSTSMGFGKCKTYLYEKDNNYQLDRVIGVWYENATKSRLMAATHGACSRIEIVRETHDPDDVYKLTRYYVMKRSKKRKKRGFFGEVVLTKGDNGLYTHGVKFPKQQNRILPENLQVMFKLVDTDYKCWAVVYGCYYASAISFHYDDVSVLVRSRNESCLNTKTDVEVDKTLKMVNTKLSKFRPVDHEDCKQYYDKYY